MEKPIIDERQYRVIRLPNQLEALLIHDPETDKASAAMDVNAGSFSDFDDLPGVAHAVEHLLFMGTEKYPAENEYNAYLTKYGGHSNAFTASTDTVYYFELSASATSNSQASSAASSQQSLAVDKNSAPLYGALDRFAQFFVKPLFLEDTLDRELRAVDSENKKNLQSDMWRFHQLNKSLSNKKHPYSKFSTGNYQVLRDDPVARGVKIRDEFIRFYNQNYSANRMKLCVLGREGLDELESWVQEHFANVPNQNLPQNRWDDIEAYGPEEKATQVFAKPVMNVRKVDIYFPYPDEEDLYASKPGQYISHLIGHEGPGSILAYLKEKGWANSLSAGASPMCPGTSFFALSLTLTEDGLKNYKEVVQVVFQYIAMLKEQPPHEWMVDEMAKIAEVQFKYRHKTPASSTTSGLSQKMQKPLPRDQLLSGGSLIREFNPEAIKAGLDALRPDNFRLTVVSQEFPGNWDQKEKWYGTEYRYEKIPSDFMASIVAAANSDASSRPAELFLPGKNEFIPQRLDVEKKEVNEPLIAPKLIRNDENVRTWFKKDDRFWVPKANINVCLRSPLAGITPLAHLTTCVFKELVDDTLAEYSYDADLAGLDYSITPHNSGIDVTVSGYNDKMSVLLEKVLVSMRDLQVRDDRFEIIKDRLLRGMRNTEYSEPFRQITGYSRWLFTEGGWHNTQLLEELPSLTANDVRQFFPQILHQLHIELLIHGNLYKEDALHISNLVEQTLKPKRLPPSQWPLKRSLALPEGSDYRYVHTLPNPDNVNHCIDYVLSIGSNLDRPLRAKLLLISQMISEPCFDTLRTKEQLGYVVHSSALIFRTGAAFRILIQSDRDCEALEGYIDNFLTSYKTTLENMSEKEFEEHKVGLINKRLERLRSLTQESDRFWHHVTSEVYDFSVGKSHHYTNPSIPHKTPTLSSSKPLTNTLRFPVHHDVSNIEPLTKSDLLTFYSHHFLPSSPSRAKTSIHLVAQARSTASEISISSPTTRLAKTLAEILGRIGVEGVDAGKLGGKFEQAKVRVEGEGEGVLEAVEGYLRELGSLGEEDLEAVLEQGRSVLPQLLSNLSDASASEDGSGGNKNSSQEVLSNGIGSANGSADAASVKSAKSGQSENKSKKAVVIEDLREWKARMPLSLAAAPLRDLSEFEEMGSKL